MYYGDPFLHREPNCPPTRDFIQVHGMPRIATDARVIIDAAGARASFPQSSVTSTPRATGNAVMTDSSTQLEPTTKHIGAPLKILVAEDNAADRFWLEMVLNSARIPYSLIPVTDGEAAKAYLQQHVDDNWDVPDLIFLDQSLPSLNAMEIVQEVPRLRSLPYCIVTGSATEKERWINEFGLSPHCYVVKPLTREKLVEFLNAFRSLRPISDALDRLSDPEGIGDHGR